MYALIFEKPGTIHAVVSECQSTVSLTCSPTVNHPYLSTDLKRSVIKGYIEDNSQSSLVRAPDNKLQVFKGPVKRIDLFIVTNIITVIFVSNIL